MTTIGNRPPAVRSDGRGPRELRPVSFQLGVQKWAEGSCLVRFGDTQVLCAATIADRVPPHLRGKGTGWVTAEYSMLPRATAERSDRESAKGRIGGRTHEISRLIGRSLRAVIDYEALGENTMALGCYEDIAKQPNVLAPFRKLIAMALSRKAEVLMAQDNYDGAISACMESLKDARPAGTDRRRHATSAR